MAAWNLLDIFRRKQIHGEGQIDIDTVTVKCMLVTATYTPNQNTHDFKDDVTNEVTGTNYTAGGNTVASVTVTVDGAGLVTVDGADPAAWAESGTGFTNARRAVLYRDSGVAATSELIAYSDDFGADKGNVGSSFQIQLAAAGIFTSPR